MILLVVFGGLPVDGSADLRTEHQKIVHSLIFRSITLLALIVGVAVKLTLIWEKVRDSDLPTDLKQ